MDQIYNQFQLKFESLGNDLDFKDVEFSPWDKSHINDLWDIVLSKEEDKSQVFTTLIIQYAFHHSKSTTIDDEYIKPIAMLFDMSHEFDSKSNDGFFLMQSFFSICNSFKPGTDQFQIFSQWFFHPSNQFRVLNLTKNNKLLGKLRPGSKLLSLFNQLQERTQTFPPQNLKIINKFRSTILNSIEINDKLSMGLEWKINDQNNKFKNVNIENSNQSPIEFLLKNFTKLLKSFNGPHGKLIDDLNKVKSIHHSIFNQYSNIIKGLQLMKLQVKQNSIVNQQEWILHNVTFKNLIQNKNKFWTFTIQNLILINSFILLSKEELSPLIDLSRGDLNKKFKLPPQLVSLLSNDIIITKLKSWVIDLNTLLEDFHNEKVSYIINQNEKTWTLMKLKAFNHPKVESLQNSLDPLNNSKRKFQEYKETHNEDRIIKKRKLIHKMGTPKLSKTWRVDNSISKLAEHDSLNDKLNTVKDELYFSKGKLSEFNEKTSDEYNEECENYKRLIWKEGRLERFNLNWFNQGDVEF